MIEVISLVRKLREVETCYSAALAPEKQGLQRTESKNETMSPSWFLSRSPIVSGLG